MTRTDQPLLAPRADAAFLKARGRDRRGLTIGFDWAGPPQPRAGATPPPEHLCAQCLRAHRADNSVTVIAKHLEMGQGAYTGIATVVAEELDADWSQVRVEKRAGRCQALRQSRLRHDAGHRRQHGHGQFLDAAARGGRQGAGDAGRRSRGGVECAAGELTVERRRRPSRAEQAPGDVRRLGGSGRPAGAEQGGAQGPEGLQAHRPAAAAGRRAGQERRHGAIHARCDLPGHAGGAAAAPAAVRRHGQVVRCHARPRRFPASSRWCRCRAASP